ncbi:MAG: alpha/beta fold hydrolase [Marmoricola sp.]
MPGEQELTPDRIPASDELRAPVGTGMELCYQTFGDPDADPLLLVMGLGGPMTWWDERLCFRLASMGFHVIRFDNRDCGRSDAGTGRVRKSDLVRAFVGLDHHAPYTLSDMADDAFGLLDHLGIGTSHVAGVSMGGMIAQSMAVARPDRVASLCSIMSTTGRRTVGWQDPRLLPRLLAPRPRDREEYVARSVAMSRRIGSPGYPEPEESARQRAETTWQRGLNPPGVLRQMMAILAQPDRTRLLHSLPVPTGVLHGTTDPMVHVSGGRATANAVPGAELVLVDRMGHDIPVELHGTFADLIRRTANRAA